MQSGGGRRRVSVQSTRSSASSPSVWEARMKMDEVKGGVKVFSAGAGDEPADEEGMRVYRRLRRNQSDGGAGATAKKRRSWKMSEPATAIGEQLRKSRSDAAASAAVVARRNVARVTTPEKKAAPAGEVKEVVVVERTPPPQESKVEAAEEDEEKLEEELETEDEEEDKEMLDQDRMAVDEDDTALHQGKELVAPGTLLLCQIRFTIN
jgi:reticulon-4